MQQLLTWGREAGIGAGTYVIARINDGRDFMVLAILCCSLAKTSCVMADPLSATQHEPANERKPLSLELAPDFAFKEPAAQFSASEFSPRKQSLSVREARDAALDAPSLSTTSVWQRLADYRAHDRVRLVTLWESSGSSLSIQAGKRGEPSLQWSSRSMNRGGATRGLLDRMVSASLAGLSSRASAAHSTPLSLPLPKSNLNLPAALASKTP
jgi:hypothetical protein